MSIIAERQQHFDMVFYTQMKTDERNFPIHAKISSISHSNHSVDKTTQVLIHSARKRFTIALSRKNTNS